MFSGGGLKNLSIFALGIMPYISASIIIQLLTVVSPDLKRLSKEDGASGLSVPVAFFTGANSSSLFFTGTPLPKDDKAAERLGPIVHAYTRQQAVDDEVVVPLLYEERNPGLDIDEMALHRWLDKISAGLDEHRKADLRSLCASKDSRCAVAKPRSS